jgi:hypothetical protein
MLVWLESAMGVANPTSALRLLLPGHFPPALI